LPRARAGGLIAAQQREGEPMAKVAIVGAGLIGRAWAIVFARAGFAAALWDPVPGAAEAARRFVAERLPELSALGLIAAPPAEVLARVAIAPSLEAAVQDAAHVQENGPERVAEKIALFAELDRLAAPDTVLASSTSGIPASAFTEALRGRARCLVAHPINPPYLVPVVELCPAPWTDPEALARTAALMRQAGQVPATMRREVPGFVVNRLQIALVSEAFRLVRDGVMSAADVDACIKHGLGLRWSFMGPFETIDLNAPAGLADYCARFGGLYEEVEAELQPLKFSSDLVASLHAERREALPLEKIPERSAWRDRRLMALAAHKAEQEE
jgi:L-gulonate 3-dehydrogenase